MERPFDLEQAIVVNGGLGRAALRNMGFQYGGPQQACCSPASYTSSPWQTSHIAFSSSAFCVK